MSGVVLRCPNCGTTRTASGECEACHEAQVRYHCTNHTPGRWLDAPACSQCGARFGVAAETAAPSGPEGFGRRPPPPAPAPRSPRAAPLPAAAPSARPGYAPSARPEAGRSPTVRGERSPPTFDDSPAPRAGRADDVEYAEPAPRMRRMPTWQELLRAAARGRPGRAEPVTESEAAPRGEQSLGGCLLRLVLFGVFLFLALISGLFVFGVSLLQMF